MYNMVSRAMANTKFRGNLISCNGFLVSLIQCALLSLLYRQCEADLGNHQLHLTPHC